MPRGRKRGAKDLQPRKRRFSAIVDEQVPIDQRQANRFANDLKLYLKEVRGLVVESVRFSWWEGAEVYKAFVKTEKRKSGAQADVFESIGGPEVSLIVNSAHCARWMLACDPFNMEMLRKYFLDIAQVVELTLTGSWQFHDATLCCTKWGDDRGMTVECCQDESG